MTRAVVLAAGMGRRLDAAGFALPKPLTPVLGRALISYTLEALEAVGVKVGKTPSETADLMREIIAGL